MSTLVNQIAAGVLSEVVSLVQANKPQLLAAAAAENATVENLILAAVTTEVKTLSPLLQSIISPILAQAVAAYAPTFIATAATEEDALVTLVVEQLQNEVKVLSA